LQPGLRICAVLLGAAAAAAGAYSQSMNPDGIAYLDMGDAFLRGDWATAINGTWSPLYALLLGLVMAAVRPPPAFEFAVVHAVNFVVFLAALFAFEYLLRQVLERYYSPAPGETAEPARLPRWAMVLASYCVFIWSSTALLPVFAVTPDMLVAISVYTAAGLLLRLGRADARWPTHAALGVALGFGYLAKAAMFPLSLVALGLALVVGRQCRRPLRSMVPALAAFVVVAAPLVTVLSLREGRPMFSAVGSYALLKHVYHVPAPPYDLTEAWVDGEVERPIDRIESIPPVYTFREPVGGTYPLSYDAAYWFRGLEPRFSARLQLQALAVNVQYYYGMLARLQGPLLGIVLILLFLAATGGQRPLWPGGLVLLILAAAALGMYGLVLAGGRYVAPFVTLFWIGLLMLVRLRPEAGRGPWLAGAGVAMTAVLSLNIITYQLDGLNALTGLVPAAPGGIVSGTAPPAARPVVIAMHLNELGLRQGDEVGVIGYSFDAFWARLARVRIVAEIAPEQREAFWNATAEQRQGVERAFAAAGVRAIVAEQVPERVHLAGWTRLGNTSYYALLLPGPVAENSSR
jgi:hypothetical protein